MYLKIICKLLKKYLYVLNEKAYFKGCVRIINKYYIIKHELTTAMQYQILSNIVNKNN